MNKKKKRRLFISFCVILILIILFSPFIIKQLNKAVYPLKYKEVVVKYAKEYNVESALIYAIVKTESGFEEGAKSGKNALGLMQITEETFDWLITKTPENDKHLKFSDLYDPDTNIRLGTYLVKLNLEYYKDESTAICAYNAGRGKMDDWLKDGRYSSDGLKIKVIPYEETKNYLNKVLAARKMYRDLYFNKGSVR